MVLGTTLAHLLQQSLLLIINEFECRLLVLVSVCNCIFFLGLPIINIILFGFNLGNFILPFKLTSNGISRLIQEQLLIFHVIVYVDTLEGYQTHVLVK